MGPGVTGGTIPLASSPGCPATSSQFLWSLGEGSFCLRPWFPYPREEVEFHFSSEVVGVINSPQKVHGTVTISE